MPTVDVRARDTVLARALASTEVVVPPRRIWGTCVAAQTLVRVKWVELQLACIAWLSGIAIAIVAACAGGKPAAPHITAAPAAAATVAPRDLPSPMERFPWPAARP